MDKKFLIGGSVAILILTAILGFSLVQKSLPSKTSKTAVPEIKKVDLSTQPDWVQKLVVTAVSGRSGNGLKNVTFKVSNLPRATVSTVNYVVQYQTANKGSQGALSTRPLDVNGATEFSKTIDFGTCSTKSCVTHDGVTAIDLELDFTTSDSSQFIWSKSLPLTN